MWNIIFTDGARKDIVSYFISYKDYFLDRFTDTGIWSEGVIRKGYEEESEKLLDESIDRILTALRSDIIPYARDIHEAQLLHTVIRMDSRYLGVSYREIDGNTRKIIHIRIWRKK